MITLYHSPKTRSTRFMWLLEEIGQPYKLERVTIRRADGSDGRDPAYRRIHPHGKVPALDHDGSVVFESAAIALYLGDAFPGAQLAPKIGDKRRAAYVTWLAYYAGVMEPAFVTKALGFLTTNSTTGWAPTDEILAYVTDQLRGGPFLLGDAFSTADVLLGSTFALFRNSPLMPSNATLDGYIERIVARPAYQRAFAQDN